MDEEGGDHLDRSCDREPKKMNILHTMKRREANWISNDLHKNCLLRHVIAGKTEEKRRRKDDVNSYWMTLREREDTGVHILWAVYSDIFA
jgi:hypothetical protein